MVLVHLWLFLNCASLFGSPGQRDYISYKYPGDTDTSGIKLYFELARVEEHSNSGVSDLICILRVTYYINISFGLKTCIIIEDERKAREFAINYCSSE